MFVKTNARTHMLIVLFLVHHPPRERLSKRRYTAGEGGTWSMHD